MRRTKYYSNYGYCTNSDLKSIDGQGIFDNISEVIKTTVENDLVRNAVSNVSKAAVKSIGKKVGDYIGVKIANSVIGKQKPKAPKTNTNEVKVREMVLEDLKLLPDDYNRLVEKYGDGYSTCRRKKVRGAGLKILK